MRLIQSAACCLSLWLTLVSAGESAQDALIQAGQSLNASRFVRSTTPPCNYEMPKKADANDKNVDCEQVIPWKAKSESEARALCLDMFPTRFVKVTVRKDDFTCTVTAVYQCMDPEAVSIYDKCFKFTKDASGKYRSETMSDYIADDAKAENDKKLCPGGHLSIFYSNQHIKFIAKHANKLGIKKLWMGTDRTGKAIPKVRLGKMIHKDLWKVVPGDYWDGDKLNPEKENDDGNYLFLRTKTDHLRGRHQGSFERATKNTKATFACEYPAYFQTEQEWYCKQLRHLGFEALYDSKDSRCVYVTTSRYTYKGIDGSSYGVKDIVGCMERPSTSHMAIIDDGMARPDIYATLSKGHKKLRLAGFRAHGEKDPVIPRHKELEEYNAAYHLTKFYLVHTPSSIFFHFTTKLKWHTQNSITYPFNENSAFPKESYTMGLVEGDLIDMPEEVNAPAVCSLKFFKECDLNSPCGGQHCTDKFSFYAIHGGYYTCTCPKKHKTITGATRAQNDCQWTGPTNECAMVTYQDKTEQWLTTSSEQSPIDISKIDKEKDIIFTVDVRKGCNFKAWTHYDGTDRLYVFFEQQKGFGTHKMNGFYHMMKKYGYNSPMKYAYTCIC